LVTKLRLQPFVVTLCGLFIYRSLARYLAGDRIKGLPRSDEQLQALRGFLFRDDLFGLPRSLAILLLVAAVATVFLHFSVWGRYVKAIGSNEKAVRYSGISTDRYKILAYVICSALASLYGVLLLMQINSSAPNDAGNFLELYAIAGAVLGGCSLRGGEGTVIGCIIGASILCVLENLVNMMEIKDSLTRAFIGAALLFGALLDEGLRWLAARRGLRSRPSTTSPALTLPDKPSG
jgi:ribose transport system permease protein